MAHTKQELSTWSDSQILQALTPKFDELLEFWNGGAHPEILFDDGYYCEVVSKKLTEADKKEWFESFCEDDCNEDEHPDFDSLLEACDYLGEDIGVWFSNQPEHKDEFIIFTFKWLLNSDSQSEHWEENLLPFVTS
jgi:hypothetical protein